MEGYPWWPAVVADAHALQADESARLPEQDMCVQCLPSAAPSVMFLRAADAEQVRPYRGEEADRELIDEGKLNAECAPAVEEALTLFAAATADATAGDSDGDTVKIAQVNKAADDAISSGSSAEDNSADEDERLLLGGRGGGDNDSAAAAAAAKQQDKRRRQHKREKNVAEAAHAKAERRKAKERKRDRRSAGSRGGGDGDSDDSDDGAAGGARHGSRKAHKAERRHRHSSGSSKQQVALDAYAEEAARAPKLPSFIESDADYVRRKLQRRRQRVGDEVLTASAQALRAAVGACLEEGTYEAEEDALLALLRPLAAYDVSYSQLCSTSIGAAVGSLLRPSFTARVTQLANGILTYWFHTLPRDTQQALAMDNEVDRCSNETTAGVRSDVAVQGLGAVGVHLSNAFTDEEINDAPVTSDVVVICQRIESLLRDRSDDLDTRVSVLTTIGDSKNTALRRAILDGRVTPEDVVAHADDLLSLLRPVNTRGLRNIRTDFTGSDAGSTPTAPYSPFSPTGFGGEDGRASSGSPTFSSPTGLGMSTFTTLYACPSCGAQEAYRAEYTVQAHDNFPEILSCRKCGNKWNIST